MTIFLISVSIILLFIAVLITFRWRRNASAQRRKYFIVDYVFPDGLMEKFQEMHPDLTMDQQQLVCRALKQFFLAHASSDCFLSMPSRVTDDLWHEFILFTKAYEKFCKNAFGKFLHHVPDAAMNKHQSQSDGMRRIWIEACKQEGINPDKPCEDPLLFSIDRKLTNLYRRLPDSKLIAS